MSDEPQPLRLKPRPPSGGELPPPPAAPTPPAADQGEGTARLRLKPRLNLTDDAAVAAQPAAPFIPPPALDPASPPEPQAALEAEEVPVFKLRPKGAPPVPPPAVRPVFAAPPPPAERQAFSAPPAPPPPSDIPAYAPAPEPFEAPPPPPPHPSGISAFAPPPEPFAAPAPPMPTGGLPPPPPPGPARGSSVSLPPMSVLSAPPPPAPGGAPEPPAAPGSVPRLSLSTPHDKAPPPPPVKGGLNLKVAAEAAIKGGGKPPVVKPGKAGKLGAVLRKRTALGPVAKAGIGVIVIAFVVAGIFFYRIFFPAPSKEVAIKLQTVVRPVPAQDTTVDAAALAAKAAEAAKLAESAAAAKRLADQAKIDAASAQVTPSPTPATESVMAQSSLSTDVTVNITHLDAAPAASAAFRTFVAGATIGGVFQGNPSRALINGTIVREGQVVEGTLGISFDRIDSKQKIIYFKDTSGAEVSKGY